MIQTWFIYQNQPLSLHSFEQINTTFYIRIYKAIIFRINDLVLSGIIIQLFFEADDIKLNGRKFYPYDKINQNKFDKKNNYI